MAAEEKKIFLLSIDEGHASEIKPVKIHFFGKAYLTNGSQDLIHSMLQFGLDDLRSDEKTITHEEGLPSAYCVLKMVSFFWRTHATQELIDDVKALEEFKTWLEGVVTTWCSVHDLEVEVLREKPGEYWRKFTVKVPMVKTTTI